MLLTILDDEQSFKFTIRYGFFIQLVCYIDNKLVISKGGPLMRIPNDASYLDNYISYAERLFIKKEQVIYHEDSYSPVGFYYLKKGLIRISKYFHVGEERIIDIVSDENSFGEQAIDGELYFSTASALEDSIIYFFPYEVIDRLMKKDHEFRVFIYKNLTDKLKILSNNLLFNSLPADKLLARTILILSEKFQTDKIYFSQQELCRYTNLNRVTIYNVFKKWEDNVVSFKNKEIVIKNKEELRRIGEI